jgi:hypothetical protein
MITLTSWGGFLPIATASIRMEELSENLNWNGATAPLS